TADIAQVANGVGPSALHLLRVSGDGSFGAIWPPGGGPPSEDPAILQDPGSGASLRLVADELGGLYAGMPAGYTDSPPAVRFQHFSSDGTAMGGGLDGAQWGLEYATRGDGGIFESPL